MQKHNKVKGKRFLLGFVVVVVAITGLFIIIDGQTNAEAGKQATITSTEVISQGCEAEISDTIVSTTVMSSEPTFRSTIWNVSEDSELSTSIKEYEEGYFDIHVNTQVDTTNTSNQTQCSGRYGIHYQLDAEVPTDSDDLVIRLIENGDEAACAYSSSSEEYLC